MGPAPRTTTFLPFKSPARPLACADTATGSTKAPCSAVKESGRTTTFSASVAYRSCASRET
jgi:hypothetical protein